MLRFDQLDASLFSSVCFPSCYLTTLSYLAAIELLGGGQIGGDPVGCGTDVVVAFWDLTGMVVAMVVFNFEMTYIYRSYHFFTRFLFGFWMGGTQPTILEPSIFVRTRT